MSHHIQKLIQNRFKKNLNVTAKTIKLLDENIGLNLYDLRFGKIILDMTQKL